MEEQKAKRETSNRTKKNYKEAEGVKGRLCSSAFRDKRASEIQHCQVLHGSSR